VAPVGTVRGRFELDAPALRTLRELERQGVRTQAQMKALGEEMDRLADQQDRRRIESYRRDVGRIGRETEVSLRQAERAWNVQTRRINRHIDTTIARVELLHSRVRALGREHAMATVGVNNVGGGGVGRTTRAVGGGLGGGGGGSGFRSVSLGPVSIGRGALLAGIGGVALPLGAAAVGGGGALLGSAGGAALGAGALGFPAAVGGGAGLGLLAATGISAGKGIGAAYEAQTKLNEAIRDFGRASDQTRAARREYFQMLDDAPRGTRSLLREYGGMRRSFRREFRPAQEQWVQTARTGVAGMNRIMPAAGSAALTTSTAFRGAAGNFTNFATGRWGRRTLGLGSNIFAENLPDVERSMENVLRTTTNLARAARPFFREGIDWMERWTRGWDHSTRDTAKTRDQIGEMVDHLRSWKNLGGATAGLLGSLGSAGAPAGQSAVDRLTGQMREWDRWVERNPQQTRAFFRRATRAAEDFAKALWEIVRALGRMSDDLLPLLSTFSQLIAGAGNLGLLTPGASALAYGAYRGARGGRGPGGGGGGMGSLGAAGAGFAAGRMGAAGLGAAGARGAAASAAIPGMYRYGGPQLVGQRRYGLGRVLNVGSRVAPAAAGAARAYAPVAALLGVLQGAGFEGSFGQKVQAGVSGATLGIFPGPNRTPAANELRRSGQDAAFELLGKLPQGRAGGQRLRQIIRRTRREATVEGVTGPIERTAGEALGAGGVKAGLNELVDAYADYRKRVRGLRLDRTTRDVQRAFQIRLAGGKPGRAIDALSDDTLRGLEGLGRKGSRQLAQNSIAWAREQARGNPKLLRHVREMEDAVVARFRRMGQRVRVINGRIYDGSKREWDRIAGALGTAAERARQEVTTAFTAIQRQALGSLRTMGFSPSQARALIRAEEGGGPGRKHAREYIGLGQQGSAPSRQAAQAGGRNAKGGRVWGAGLGDNVSVGKGQKAAPGEAILSHDIERGIDADLARAGRPPVGARLGGGRPHGWTASKQTAGHTVPRSMMAQGGRIVPIPWAPGERTNSSILRLLTRIHRGFGVNVSDSFGPGHQSPGHTQYGTAVDFVPGSTGWQGVNRLVAWAARRGYKVLYDGRFGSTAWPNHGEGHHAHVEFGSGGAAGGVPAGGMGSLGRVRLRAPRSRLGGAPGGLSNAAAQMYAGGLQRHINRRIGSGGLGGFSGGGGADANRRLARRMMRAAGWPASEWGALNALWTQESGFRTTADNPTSDAYGIPQSLPGSKMASSGADWRTNPATQIAWGLKYIRGRYGSPSAAWAFHRGHNWYSRGGRIPSFQFGGGFDVGPGRRGGLIRVGDNPLDGERISIKPIRRRRRGAPDLGGLGGRPISVSVTFAGPVSVRSEADIEKIAERASEKAGKKLLAILDGTDGEGV
jgi:hypothetical protein